MDVSSASSASSSASASEADNLGLPAVRSDLIRSGPVWARILELSYLLVVNRLVPLSVREQRVSRTRATRAPSVGKGDGMGFGSRLSAARGWSTRGEEGWGCLLCIAWGKGDRGRLATAAVRSMLVAMDWN